eukprot:TRINITY_DN24198_c0_g3_i1.p1 TRINITY_DN24198_c0_g3~~TRINITY_DN24198_c0_g3_i1.p1  ORF type:complete len:125 (-),score=4.04 TRINITY_DN24198_c0_g3_i1:49-423(-)
MLSYTRHTTSTRAISYGGHRKPPRRPEIMESHQGALVYGRHDANERTCTNMKVFCNFFQEYRVLTVGVISFQSCTETFPLWISRLFLGVNGSHLEAKTRPKPTSTTASAIQLKNPLLLLLTTSL